MTVSRTLFLHQEILLLALHDEEGTPEFGAWYQQALGGAVLAELLLRGRVEVDDSKKKIVRVCDDQPLGELVLDECLAQMSADGPRGVEEWVGRLGRSGDLKHRVAEGLCERGVLRSDRARVLMIFSRRAYPEVDPGPEREIVERMRRAIFEEDEPVDTPTMVLVSLADATGILRTAFDKKDLAARKARLEQIRNGDVASAATAGAVQAAIVASTVVTVMVPVFISS